MEDEYTKNHSGIVRNEPPGNQLDSSELTAQSGSYGTNIVGLERKFPCKADFFHF